MTKIMLVEDDKSLREIYGVRLIAEGYEIISAGDGEEALAMAVKEKPNLILSDVMMPKISGFDMLDILRATPETKDIKVIMMTALSSEDQRARGEKLGANKYLVKSQVGIEDVVRAVHETLADAPTSAPTVQRFGVPAQSAAIINQPVEVSPRPPVIEPPVMSVQSSEAVSHVTTATPTPPTVPAEAQPILTTETNEPVVNQPIEPVQQTIEQPIVPEPIPEPVQPIETTEQPVVAPEPTPIPQPAFEPNPNMVINPPQPVVAETMPIQPAEQVPIEPDPVPQPVVAEPIPVAPPTQLPQPTAPFSTAAPASLGEMIINPITPQPTDKPDMASLIDQELHDGSETNPIPPAP